jgi:hypothetical protein
MFEQYEKLMQHYNNMLKSDVKCNYEKILKSLREHGGHRAGRSRGKNLDLYMGGTWFEYQLGSRLL